MRRHWKKLALLLAATAIAACVLLALPSAEPEPSYQGRTLTEWLFRMESDSQGKPTTDALLHMGTNALPYLVKWACHHRPKLRVAFEDLCWKYQKICPDALLSWADSDNARAVHAMTAFNLLHRNATSALPQLNLIAVNTNHPGLAQMAQNCIAGILYGSDRPDYDFESENPTATQLEHAALSDPDPIIRQAATNAHPHLEWLHSLARPKL